MKRLITTMALVICCISFSQNVNTLWKSSIRFNKSINKNNLPLAHLFDLDLHTLKNALTSSPKWNTANVTSNAVITLPNGDGKLENFRVYENTVMAPELATKYPEIKSYIAIGIDNPSARAYFSNSPLGFKSMTLYPDKSTVFIEPISTDLNTYTIYKKSDKKEAINKFECGVIDTVVDNIPSTTDTSMFARGADDAKLRTFRLALSCTGEYAALFGGSKSLVLASMNNTITRINGIYERDFGVRLILIANNDAVIYTDATTDPYSTKTNWHTELQTNFTAVIGEANYDIGHLFGTSTANCGDAGCVGCVCTDNYKGNGYTCASSSTYNGDNFDIDYVSHEIGHQLGANHTFTYKNDNSIAQMEPGSGSTIMSYAGVTVYNVQTHHDAYFHTISIQQVTDNIKTKTCPVITSTGNAIPVVNAGLDYTIPKGTPFMLTGIATDANTDDALTYTWEEMDLGNATASIPTTTATAGPLFRSYPPSVSSTRYFPNMSTLLTGATTTSGLDIPVEVLSGVSRTLNFRLTVRDNRAGGSANNTDDTVITVDGTAGPFTIDSQNSAISYTAGTTQTVNWTVAGTDANGVNCATVDILLSTDGGKTFPITLLSGTPNNGAANVIIPNIVGTTNRIMVKGTSQIFFDINNVNFTINSNFVDTSSPTASILSDSGTTTSSTNLSWTTATDNIGVANYDVYQNGALITSTTATSFIASGLNASTIYSFYIVAKDAAGNKSNASNIVNAVTLSTVTNTLIRTYCSSYGTSTAKEYINKFQMGTINTISGNNNGYGDFTSTSTNLSVGTSNTILISPTWNSTAVNEYYRVWIDFNQDNDFNDNGELVFSKSRSKSTSVSGSIIIPTTCLTGTTRMRISMKNGALPSPCEIFSYGEVEDYTINITNGTMARAESSSEVANIETTILSFNLYPNPVKEDVIYISDININPDYRIFNMLGQEIVRGTLKDKVINIGQLTIGTYIIELTDGVETATKQFVKY